MSRSEMCERCDTGGGKEQSAVTLHADRACARFGHSEHLLTNPDDWTAIGEHGTLHSYYRTVLQDKLHYGTPFVYMPLWYDMSVNSYILPHDRTANRWRHFRTAATEHLKRAGETLRSNIDRGVVNYHCLVCPKGNLIVAFPRLAVPTESKGYRGYRTVPAYP